MWRHGDVLIAATKTIPKDAQRRPHSVLAFGEVTGHSHRIAEPDTAELWEQGGMLYLNVTANTASVIHEEHNPITLPRGTYRVWMQREYSPEAIRRIVD